MTVGCQCTLGDIVIGLHVLQRQMSSGNPLGQTGMRSCSSVRRQSVARRSAKIACLGFVVNWTFPLPIAKTRQHYPSTDGSRQKCPHHSIRSSRACRCRPSISQTWPSSSVRELSLFACMRRLKDRSHMSSKNSVQRSSCSSARTSSLGTGMRRTAAFCVGARPGSVR